MKGYLGKQIKDICYNADGSVRKRILISISLSLFGAAVFIWFIFHSLYYDEQYRPGHKINLSNAANIGDFVGGFVGAFFSIVGVILLYETLALQRKEFEENRKVLRKEQFENTFFAIINFYHDALSKISEEITLIEFETHSISNLQYFEFKRKELYETFNPTKSILKDSKSIKIAYTNFYLRNKTALAIYFRTLYRIYNFIDQSAFDSKTKMEYAKLFRAQLNQDELFFIYYNAYSDFGLKSRNLINKFNICKHLPLLQKLEYKDFALKLNQVEKASFEKLWEDIRIRIKQNVNNNKNYYYKDFINKRYKLSINFSQSEIKLILIIDNSINIDPLQLEDGYGIHIFSGEEIENFIKIFLKDTFNYSNFNEYNAGLKFQTNLDVSHQFEKITAYVLKLNETPFFIV